jgi:hypothetical protein
VLQPDDIRNAAKLLITKYGRDAFDRATLRAEALHAVGDIEGSDRWTLVARAVQDIESRSATAPATRG